MTAADETDYRHASSMRCNHATQAVFDHETPFWPDTLLFGGMQKQVRAGLPRATIAALAAKALAGFQMHPRISRPTLWSRLPASKPSRILRRCRQW
jgi:hypothetical protein